MSDSIPPQPPMSDDMSGDYMRQMAERARKAQEAIDALGAGKPSGLPQSEHGGLHPELRARITAARAAIGDYELGPHPDQVAWMMQADRLAAELRSLLEFIERHSR